MRFALHICCCILLLAGGKDVHAQLSNARQKTFTISNDTIYIDSLSTVPGSFYLMQNGILTDTSFYSYDDATSRLIIRRDTLKGSEVTAVYRVLPLALGATWALRSVNDKKLPGRDNRPYYIYSDEDPSRELFRIEGLNKSGSISRGITIGNNQDAVVNSTLNLQLSGKLNNNIEVAAAITDDNIPVQPEGNTQQLQEFDKVYIQLSNENNKLIAGDFDVTRPSGYFMQFYKRGQGGWYSNKSSIDAGRGKKAVITSIASAAVSKGKFARNTFNGIESNQGPYRLTGAENETFIVILSGSERIYIDGRLMKRGQSYDYIIDYNTAEITFTPQRLITKDVRIVAEFQYSERNYSRTLLFGGTEGTLGKSKAYINVYSEQDAKNQPVQQDLSLEQKKLLASVGDNINSAYTLNADSVAFNPNEILYLKKDSTVNGVTYKDVYVWSVNPDSAFYRLGFSLTGANKGNYILSVTSANGKVFQWVAPINNIPQGNYEPVVLLITPKKRQMATAGYIYSDKGKMEFSVELAASKDDINTFSKLDKNNDDGWGAVTNVSRTFPVIKTKVPWNLVTTGRYEFTYHNFRQIENFRAVEFTRDWNTTTLRDTSDEHIIAAGIALQQGPLQNISYTLRSYIRPGTYQGLMHAFSSMNTLSRITLKTDASYLTTDGDLYNSLFIRHREDLSRQWKNIKGGVRYEEERNKTSNGTSDTLSMISFAFRESSIYIEMPDSLKLRTGLLYTHRIDELPSLTELKQSSVSDNVAATAAYNINRSNKVGLSVKYRKLAVEDTTLTTQRPDESLLSRVDHQLNLSKGFLTANTYYEAGSGREQKRDFTYVAVAPGTGNFAWIDYNGDGIPQLNEFETPQFQDQAAYVRIFTPSNEYIKVFTNQLNLVLNIQPAALQLKNKFWSKFGLLTAWRFDNKISGSTPEEGLNPFLPVYDETKVIATSAGNRNTLFINKTGEITGTDISYNDQQSRQLLSTGIETRRERELLLNNRINITKSFTTFTDLGAQIKTNESQAFNSRNYVLDIYKAGEKLSYQPGSVWRVSLLYNITEKKNTAGENGERSLMQKGGTEFRYSSVKRGLFTAGFNIVYIEFNRDENTSLSYEMLEGLKKGINYTWSASVQRNISSSFQVSINYEARKPEGLKIIHTGGIQARAFF